MSNTGENIYKRKDGRWEGRYIKLYSEGGKSKYGYVYARTYREVKQKLLEYKFLGQISETEKSHESITYDRLLATWLHSVRINVKESTYATYTNLIELHIRPWLGDYDLSMITTSLIEQFISEKIENGRIDKQGGLSSKTVSDMLTIIRSSLDYGNNNDFHTQCNLKKISIKRKDKEMRVLSVHEQHILVATLLNDMDLYKFGVLLSLFTGIRLGELCALQWEDINLLQSSLKVKKTMIRIKNTDKTAESKTKVVITEPKSTRSIREIPLPDFLLTYAKRFKGDPKSYILSGDNQRFVEPRTMQNYFKRYIKECNIAEANFHSLRHTFATRCVEVGFELKSLSEILGHSSVNITLNRYVHSSFELKMSNMEKMTTGIFSPS